MLFTGICEPENIVKTIETRDIYSKDCEGSSVSIGTFDCTKKSEYKCRECSILKQHGRKLGDEIKL